MKTDAALDSMFEDLETSLTKEFPHYQVKKYFYVLIRRRRGNILDEKRKQLFHIAENVSKSIYYNHCRNYKDLTYNFFPCFKFIRNYGNYHFHFLVIRSEYKT